MLARQASALYETIEAAESVDESGLPDQAYTVPDNTLGAQAPLGATAGAGAGAGAGSKADTVFDATH